MSAKINLTPFEQFRWCFGGHNADNRLYYCTTLTILQHDTSAANDSEWFRMVLNDFEWFRMIPDNSGWRWQLALLRQADSGGPQYWDGCWLFIHHFGARMNFSQQREGEGGVGRPFARFFSQLLRFTAGFRATEPKSCDKIGRRSD